MQTNIINEFLQTPEGEEANNILRSCVHCGFCNATCPTYQIRGDELDGPRGRIYLIKQVLEGHTPSKQTQLHLDRCLTCRNCETTCPSGVQYSRLLDTGRRLVEKTVRRPLGQRLFRTALRKFLLSPAFNITITIGRFARPLLPKSIRQLIPKKNTSPKLNNNKHDKKILLIEGCVQKALQPSIDTSAINVFNALDLETVLATSSDCCGALNHHLNAENDALKQIKNNIDSWLSLMDSHSIKTITMTASGCGSIIRDYQYILQNDISYAEKAKRISHSYLDPIEIMDKYNGNELQSSVKKRIAFHPPCTLQHGQKITGKVEKLLKYLGYELIEFDDTHLCCGSAGTYSITQKSLSQQLLSNKLKSIQPHAPEMIITANIGCQTHLQSGTDIPVLHWLELIAPVSRKH